MSLARQAAHNAITISLTAATSLLLSIIAARSLGPTAMGAYAWLAWLLAMGAIAINLGGITTTLKHLAQASGHGEGDEAAGVLAHGLRRWGRNAVAVSILWLALAPWGAGQSPVSLPIWLLAGSTLVPATLQAFLAGACQGLGRHGQLAAATAGWAVLQLLGAALAGALGAGLGGLLVAQGLAQTLGCILLARALSRWRPGWRTAVPSTAMRRALGAYAGPVALVVLLDAIVWQRSGVFFLQRWAPPVEVASYALAFALAQMVMRTAPGALVGVLLPTMARARGAGDLQHVARTYRRAGRWLALVSLPVAVLGAWAAPALVVMLYGQPYAGAAAPLAVLLAAGAASMALGFPASSALYALDRQVALLRVGLGGAVLYVGGACWLLPGGGALEAALVTCGAQAFCLAAGTVLASKALGGTWPDLWGLARALALAASMLVPLGACEAVLPPAAALPVGIALALAWLLAACWCLPVLPPEDRAAVARRLARWRHTGVTTVTTRIPATR